MKKALAVFAVICLLAFSFALPCAAYIDSSNNPVTGFDEAGTANGTITASHLNRYTFGSLLSAIDKAYTLGLFGGACPMAVRISGGVVYVYCLPPNGAVGLPREYGAYMVPSAGTTSNWLFKTINNSNVEVSVTMSVFTMTREGSFVVNSVVSQTVYSGLVARREDGEWDTSGWDSQGWISTSVGNQTPDWILSAINRYNAWLAPPSNITYLQGYEAGYNYGYNAGLVDGSPTELELPSIFDAMFGGIRAIFTGIDIEIFGVSILGTLVSVLVIAIIAFVVRRLTK